MFDTVRYLKRGGRSEGRSNKSRQHRSPHHRRLLCEALETRTMLSALALVQQARLTASNGAAASEFGIAVAVSGTTMVVGEPDATVGGNSAQGAVYVFTESGSSWTQVAELTASDGAAKDHFGFSVSISADDTIVVGAYHATVGGNSGQGAAYVFTESGTVWTQEAKVTASDGVAGNDFGYSVAISSADDTIVVGAWGATVGGNSEQGTAYVFAEPSGGWTNMAQTAKLTASDGAADNVFGNSVAIDSETDTVVVAADAPFSGPGAAYVFTAPSGGWASVTQPITPITQTAEFTASNGAEGDRFGNSVSISDNTVVVGAYYDTVGGNVYQGAAYVFTEPSGGWASVTQPMTQTAELTSSDGHGGDTYLAGNTLGDAFGSSVSISGNTVVVGAENAWGKNTGQGAAYVFAEPNAGWANMTQTQKLTASDNAGGDFGASVGFSGSTVVVAAPMATIGSNAYQGAAYVFGSAPLGLSQTSIPPDTMNVAYNQTIAAVGGTGTVKLSVSNISGAIPGLTVPSSGTGSLTISGTPKATGTETFTVTAKDQGGDTASATYSITVNPALTLSPTAGALQAITESVHWIWYVQPSGGTGAVITTSNVRNVIPGLTVTPYGVAPGGAGEIEVYGTPTATGKETFTVTATDAVGATTTANYSITVNPVVTLSPATLPAGTVKVAYRQTITGSGGTGGIVGGLVVSNISGAIKGLTVQGSGTGSVTISGTPTATGTETFTVTATDTVGYTVSVNYSITVNPSTAKGAVAASASPKTAVRKPGLWELPTLSDEAVDWVLADFAGIGPVDALLSKVAAGRM
jgi:hypothetical protein